jgi:O-antigen ligase
MFRRSAAVRSRVSYTPQVGVPSLVRAAEGKPSSAETLWLNDVHNPIRQVGLQFAMVFVFLRFTGLHEILTAKLGVNTFLLYIFGIPAFLALMLSGGIRRTMHWQPIRYWIGFLASLIASIPFSFYVLGSLALVLTFLRTEVICLLLITGLVMTWKEFWRLLHVLVGASILQIAFGKFFSEVADDRLSLAIGTMSNANDYAAELALLLPFLFLVMLTPGRSIAARALSLVCITYGLYLTLSTGSRGALIALSVGVLFALWRTPLHYRIFAGILTLMVGGALALVLPGHLTTRLASIVSDKASEADTVSAGSAKSRLYLLKKSLLFTATHPLFGVGPGEFSDFEGLNATHAGLQGAWHETHNSYTQVSSEAGIPAFIFFVAAIISTYRMINRVYQRSRTQPPTPENQRIMAAAFWLMISMVTFCSAIFFLSLAYRFYLPALTGLAIALTRAAGHEWEQVPGA